MVAHKYAGLTPMSKSANYNAISDVSDLGDSDVNNFLSITDAKDVQFVKNGDLVDLFINGNKHDFKTKDKESLRIKDIPTMIEVMKMNSRQFMAKNNQQYFRSLIWEKKEITKMFQTT